MWIFASSALGVIKYSSAAFFFNFFDIFSDCFQRNKTFKIYSIERIADVSKVNNVFLWQRFLWISLLEPAIGTSYKTCNGFGPFWCYTTKKIPTSSRFYENIYKRLIRRVNEVVNFINFRFAGFSVPDFHPHSLWDASITRSKEMTRNKPR